jgi:hypothetical protein
MSQHEEHKADLKPFKLTVDQIHLLISGAVIRHPDGDLMIEGFTTHKDSVLMWYQTAADHGSHIVTIKREGGAK